MILVVRVAGRLFAIPAASIERVMRMVEVTPLPGAPSSVLGVLNLRGSVIPVVNLRPLLGLAPAAPDPTQYLVIVSSPRRFGVWIDHVEQVAQPRPTDFERVAAPSSAPPFVVRLAGAVIPVLGPAALDPGSIGGAELR